MCLYSLSSWPSLPGTRSFRSSGGLAFGSPSLLTRWFIFCMNLISWYSERLPASSLRLSSMSAIDLGSSSRFCGSIWITQISSGFALGSSRMGGFCENRPSQYTPPSVCTALNRVGSAVEARIVSAEISSLRLLKARNSPESTSTAPTRSIGLEPSRGVSIFLNLTRFSSISFSRLCAQDEVGVLYGLISGRTTVPCSRFTQRNHSFNSQSWSSLAELSFQKESSSRAALAAAPPPLCWISAYQARTAQMAPPEVPLTATTSYLSSSSSFFSAPAVKAVWLPPPWQAIATRVLPPSRSMTSSFLWSILHGKAIITCILRSKLTGL